MIFSFACARLTPAASACPKRRQNQLCGFKTAQKAIGKMMSGERESRQNRKQEVRYNLSPKSHLSDSHQKKSHLSPKKTVQVQT
jgi:hypothetical protein